MGSEQNRQHCNSKFRKWQHPNPGHQVLFTLFHQPTLSFKSTIFSKLPKIVITLYSELHRHKVLSWKLSLEEEAFPLIPDNSSCEENGYWHDDDFHWFWTKSTTKTIKFAVCVVMQCLHSIYPGVFNSQTIWMIWLFMQWEKYPRCCYICCNRYSVKRVFY